MVRGVYISEVATSLVLRDGYFPASSPKGYVVG